MAEGKPLVGVDIGATSIKVCQLKETRKGYALIRLGYHPLEPQTIVSIRSFFLNAGEQHPDALTNLRLQGFGPAEPEQVDNWVEVVKPGGNQASASRTSLAAAG